MLTCDAFQLIKSFQRKCTIIILPFAILDSHHIFSFFFCLAKTILGVSFDNHCIKDCCVCLWWWWKFWSWLRKHFYRVCHSKKTLKTRQMKKREIFSYKDKERKTATSGSSSKVTQVSVTSWMIFSIPPTHRQKVKLTQNQTKFNCVYSNSQTLGFVLFFISLRKSKNCITGLGLSQGEQKKVNSWHTLDWWQSTLDPTRLSQNWKPVSTQYTSTAKHTGEKLNTTLIVCRHRRFQSFGLLLFSTITHIS